MLDTAGPADHPRNDDDGGVDHRILNAIAHQMMILGDTPDIESDVAHTVADPAGFVLQQVERFQQLPPEQQHAAVMDLQRNGVIDANLARTYSQLTTSSGSGGSISDTVLRSAINNIRADIPEPSPEMFDFKPLGRGFTTSYRSETGPVTTSAYFALDHWHWLELNHQVPGVPRSFGPFPMHIQLSDSQIMHDLTEWGVLHAGELDPAARTRIEAVTGRTQLAATGTVMLHSLKRDIDPDQLPSYVTEYGLEQSISTTPRVHIAIGVTRSEIVSVLHNNGTLVWRHRPRADKPGLDVADEIFTLIDPNQNWQPHAMPTLRIRADVNADLVAHPDASRQLPPSPDPKDASEAAEQIRLLRATSREAVLDIAVRAHLDRDARRALADLSQYPTTASATFTITNGSPEPEPAAVGIALLDGAGIVVTYPEGTGRTKAMMYRSGTRAAVADGIYALLATR